MYVDGLVIPVPKDRLEDYRRIAVVSAEVWRDHGALGTTECMGDDVPMGKLTSFPQAVDLKEGEVVFFSWITYASRAERDRINAAVMEDPRMKEIERAGFPFDTKRMFWGGFEVFLQG